MKHNLPSTSEAHPAIYQWSTSCHPTVKHILPSTSQAHPAIYQWNTTCHPPVKHIMPSTSEAHPSIYQWSTSCHTTVKHILPSTNEAHPAIHQWSTPCHLPMKHNLSSSSEAHPAIHQGSTPCYLSMKHFLPSTSEAHPAIHQTAHMDAWKKYPQTLCTSLPEDEQLDVRNMSKTLKLNLNFNVKGVHFVGSFYLSTFILSRSVLPRKWTVLTKCVEKIKTRILRSVKSFRKSCRLWDNMVKTWHTRTGHRWQYGSCALHCGYLRLESIIQNTWYFCFSTAQWLLHRVSVYVACVVILNIGRSRDCGPPPWNVVLSPLDRQRSGVWLRRWKWGLTAEVEVGSDCGGGSGVWLRWWKWGLTDLVEVGSDCGGERTRTLQSRKTRRQARKLGASFLHRLGSKCLL